MAIRRVGSPRTEPAHSFLYDPSQLQGVTNIIDTGKILEQISHCLKNPFNERQVEAFFKSFTERLLLLWGPPGTGKTTVLAGIILGWMEQAWTFDIPIRIGIGASNYNAIDNVLSEIADLFDRRRIIAGDSPMAVHIARVRSESAYPPLDNRIEDIIRTSDKAKALSAELMSLEGCIIVGGTWMQLVQMAITASGGQPISEWFNLLVIDEASQVPVSSAAAYFLLLKPDAHVVLAGDHKQLGPIYGFEMRDSAKGLFDCIFSYMQETHEKKPVALNQNYRTNIEISGWPKERFYSEGYEAFFPKRRLGIILPKPCCQPPDYWQSQLPWSDELLSILAPDMPVTVISYDAHTFTLSNSFEAQMVASLAYLYRSVLHQNGDSPSDEKFWSEYLGIVTPHRAQMSMIRNLIVESAGMSMDPPPFVDTVDRFQGQERDLMIASYVVADRDFVASEEEFILNPRRFNVTLTRARSKFIMFVSDAVLQHLPSDADVARDAAHLQLFVENYCSSIGRDIELPYYESGVLIQMKCRLRGRNG